LQPYSLIATGTAHEHTSHSQESGCQAASTVRRAHEGFMP
jgi:hypothetical protein